jgi:predicted RNA binding protein YcfA (HicA-like mRNA interferase family)
MKVRDIIRLLERDGWYLKQTRESHRQYKHPRKPGRVTLPGHPNDDLPPGTLNSVLKQAGLKPLTTLLFTKNPRPDGRLTFPTFREW